MARYAVLQDLIDRYGADAVVLATDRANAGTIDLVAAERALSDACDEVDVYAGQVAELPLAQPPTSVVRLVVDIAMYRASSDAGTCTEERRTRYDDAVALLKLAAAGKVSLFGTLPAEEEPAPIEGVRVAAGEPLFGPERWKAFR
jgi:phage gp36-like protein